MAADRTAHPTYWEGSDPHVDGLQWAGGHDFIIRGNWVEAWDTSDLIIKADFSAINGVLVEGNTLTSDPTRPHSLVSSPIIVYSVGANLTTNVTIRNNRIQSGQGGGYYSTSNATPTVTGNVDYFTGLPVS